MKKAFKFLMCAAIVAAGFMACSDEVTPIDPDPINPPQTEPSGPTYATFNFEGLQTKALTLDGTESDVVDSLRVLIFNGNAPAAADVAELDTTVGAKNVTILLPSAGDKKIYVVANDHNTDNLELKGASMTYGTLTNVINVGTKLDDLTKVRATNGKFFMSNRQDSTSFRLTPNISETDAKNPTNGNYINLGIRRAVAKSAITQSSAFPVLTVDIGNKGSISSATYRLWNVNKDIYPFWVGYSPNSSGLSWTDTITLQNYYGYRVGLAPSGEDFISISYSSARPQNNYYYVSENNRRLKSDFNYRNSTYAAIKAIYTPQGGYHYTTIDEYAGVGSHTFKLNAAAGAATIGTFWRLIKENVELYNFVPALPDTALFTNRDAVKQMAYHFTVGSGVSPLALPGTAAVDTISDWTIKRFFIEYTNGEAWYRYDLGDGELDNAVDKPYEGFNIGIHRNTAYWANITGYKGLGQPREDSLNIEGPMVNGPTFLTVEAIVIPWVEAEGTAIL